MTITIPTTIQFEEAIALTQSLLQQQETQAIDITELSEAISKLLTTQNGARGFFVCYLTGDWNLADNPPPSIIKAISDNQQTTTELLVKNLAMSAAMELHHQRDNNQDMANSSQRVCQRTANLIKLVQLDSIYQELKELQQTIKHQSDTYQNFINRWGYDTLQQEKINQTIQTTLSHQDHV